MSASGLRLNAIQTQVLWLGSRHNVDRFTVHDVQVLASSVGVVSSARDLGVVIDSWLTLAAPRCVTLSLSVLSFVTDWTDTTIIVDGCCTSTAPGVSFQLLGLLQLGSVRRHRQSCSTSTAS